MDLPMQKRKAYARRLKSSSIQTILSVEGITFISLRLRTYQKNHRRRSGFHPAKTPFKRDNLKNLDKGFANLWISNLLIVIENYTFLRQHEVSILRIYKDGSGDSGFAPQAAADEGYKLETIRTDPVFGTFWLRTYSVIP